MYKAEDCGLFIGLTTMPFGQERAFYENEIAQGIFRQYKERLQQFGDPTDESEAAQAFHQYFYRPKAYRLFGNFDLAVLSLVDDFAMSSRVFHPYSSLAQQAAGHRPGSFKYQTITGPVPDLSHAHPASREEHLSPSPLIGRAKRTFLASHQQELAADSVYPFIGICSLKINNALLIGAGGRSVQLVLRALKGMLEQSEEYKEQRLDYLILSSFSWNEINLIVFSDSYKCISRQILRVRELALRDLQHFGQGDLYEKTCSDSLLGQFIRQRGMDKEGWEVAGHHVFVETHSTLGFDFDLVCHPEWLEQRPDHFKEWHDISSDDLKLYLRWHIKPGHLQESLRLLPPQAKQRIVIGRGDIIQPLPQADLTQLLQQLNQLSSEQANAFRQHIRKIYTVPEIIESSDQLPGSPTSPLHLALTEEVGTTYAFSVEEIAEVRRLLKQCRVSKILLDKLVNMYVNFNDGIQDPILYGYFIELRPFLEHIQQEATSFQSADSPYQTVKQLSEVLQRLCQAFELAYRNRFQQSYIMNEITDYNLEFSGGIQQLVSAFDGAFKGISTILGCKDRFLPIAYISSHSGIESDFYTVKLNYYHLFHPEFFVAVATHEASNFFLERLDTASGNLDEYLDLHRLFNDKVYCNEHSIPDAVSYFPVDIITYYLGYNTNGELFSYWHWGNFVSTSLYYNTDGSINENLFAQLMLRIFLLLQYRKEADQLSADRPPCTLLADCWRKYFGPITSLAKSLLNNPRFQIWYSYSETMAKEAVIDDFTGITEKRQAVEGINTRDYFAPIFDEVLLKQHDVREKERFLQQYSQLQEREVLLLLGRLEEMENVSNDMMDAFRKGIIFERRDFDVLQSNSFRIHSLFYAYLKLLKQLNGDRLEVLPRNAQGEPSHGTSSENCLLFDGMGGVFTRNFALRRSYFRYRSLLIQSLWHIATKSKIKLFGKFADGQ